MQFVPLDQIYIDLNDRVRKHFPTVEAQELGKDIEKNGLYSAPIVIKLDPPIQLKTKTCDYKLVAGHRRLSAIRRLYDRHGSFSYNAQPVDPGFVPVIFAKDDKPETIKEIELHENIMRVDLSWQEKAEALAQLHELRTTQNPKQTFKSTAKELAGPDGDARRYQRSVSNAVTIYKHRNDPDVTNARTERDALAAILRKHEEAINRAVKKPRQQTPHRLLYGDSLELLKKLQEKSFSCLLTDPPYGIEADNFGDAAKLSHDYDDDKEQLESLYNTLFRECERVLTEDAHIYIFCDVDGFHMLKTLAESYGFKAWRTPLTWNKGNRGHLPSGTSSGWRRSSEWVFHAMRGARLHTGVMNDVIDAEWKEEKIHGAQKPIDLYYKLLKMSCYPGEHILDPFCGSGPIFKAGRMLSLKATGIEKKETWINHIESAMDMEREELI